LQQIGGTTNYRLDFVVSASAPPTWNIDTNGNWSTAGNWTASVPNVVGARAVFGGAITAPRTVTLDVPITVGQIDLDNANAYTIGGTNSLTIDATSGAGEINVLAGSHVISAPVSLTDNTQISVTPAAGNLTLGSALNASGVNVTKVGAGRLTVNQIDAAGLAINEGSVAISSGAPASMASLLGTLSIAGAAAAPTAQLDLGSNAIVVDYTGVSPASAIRSQLIAGRGGAGLGATWTGQGIASSTAGAAEPETRSVGYAENASLPLGAYTTFRGRTVDDTSLLLAYTRTGDANLDGVVNDDDVTIVGATYAPGVPQPSWALGDFDFNGFVDDDDVTLLGVFYDPTAEPLVAPVAVASNGIAAVPEPHSMVYATSAIALLLASPYCRKKARRGT
jgi:hypothetical protein